MRDLGLRTVALVTHALDGGVGSTVRFLARVLGESGRYEPHVFLLASSVRDAASVRLLGPVSWLRGPRVVRETHGSLSFGHVGAWWAEFEALRYRPRRTLDHLLRSFDLIQVVAGPPAWAGAVLNAGRPVCLFAATTAAQERVSLLRGSTGWRRRWLRAMTRITSRIERSVISTVDCVFAESQYTYDLLAGWRGDGRMRVAPPGVDTSLFVPAEVSPRDGHILAVGRLADPRKNVGLLLRAYRRLRDAIPEAPRLVLVGHTPLRAGDAALVGELGLTPHVEIHVDVTIEALRGLYRGASMFVLPSNEEGLGIVLLEAMACGLPVASTDCGGPRAAVVHGETGFLTPVGDVGALAAAMSDLWLDPPQRERMGRAGRILAEREFSLAAASRAYLDEYEVVLSAERTQGFRGR